MKSNKNALAWIASVALLVAIGCSAEKKEEPDLGKLTKDVWNRLRVVERKVRDAQHDASRDEFIEYAKLTKKLATFRASSAGDIASSVKKLLIMTLSEIEKMNKDLDGFEKELEAMTDN